MPRLDLHRDPACPNAPFKQVTAMARKQYPLRIDPAIWEAVQRWADDEMRSANGQVEWILRDALKRAGRLPKREEKHRDDERS